MIHRRRSLRPVPQVGGGRHGFPRPPTFCGRWQFRHPRSRNYYCAPSGSVSQYLFGVEEHLELNHKGLAFVAHLADVSVSFVEGCFVGALVVFDLVVEFLDLLLEKRVAAFQVGELGAHLSEGDAELLDLLLGVVLLLDVAVGLGVDLLYAKFVPGLHIGAVGMGDLVIFRTDVTDGSSQLVLEVFAVLGGGVAVSKNNEVTEFVAVNAVDVLAFLQKGLDLVLEVDTAERLLLDGAAGAGKLSDQTLVLPLDTANFLLEVGDLTLDKVDFGLDLG